MYQKALIVISHQAIKIKTTMWNLSKPNRMVKMKTECNGWLGSNKQGSWTFVNWHSHLGKLLGSINLSWTYSLLYDPTIPLLDIPIEIIDICLPKVIYKNVQNSVIHNGPNLERTQMSINRTDSLVLSLYIRILYRNEHEWTTVTVRINFANIILNENS